MRALILAGIVTLLTGCFGGTGTRMTPAGYDFAVMPAAAETAQPIILGQIEVQSPTWLDTTAMQYRLAYADQARRQAYAESRWVAPPAKLLEHRLKQRLLPVSMGGQAAGCRLRIELDEFVQVFDAPDSSRALLEMRATLLPPRAQIPLAGRSFRLAPAAGADARAGAAAFAAASMQLGEEIGTWLEHAVGRTPALLERCRLG